MTEDKYEIISIQYDFYYKECFYFIKGAWRKEKDIFNDYNLALTEYHKRLACK